MKLINALKLLSIATLASTSVFFTSCEEKKNTKAASPNIESQRSYTPRLTTRSNGYDWNKASYSQKRTLAKKLSDIVRRKGISDCSANFYFDALNEAYDTNSSFSLSQTIDGVAGACTGMAESLPAHRRNY